MTAFFFGVQKAGKGDGEVPVAVVDRGHGRTMSAWPAGMATPSSGR